MTSQLLYGVKMMRENGRWWLRGCVFTDRDQAELAAKNIATNNQTLARVVTFKPTDKRYAAALALVEA